MADPITIATVVTTAASLAQGFTSFRAAQAERAQYEEERKAAELAGQQEEVLRRQRLAKALATQNALRAARGLSLTSPQADVIRRATVREAESDIAAIRLDSRRRQRRFGLAAEQAGLDAAGALIGGVGRAAGNLFTLARARRETGKVD
ncbi:MAG TPA: hypothetical protein ENJ38_11215 [Rhodospirillales bacterium]|nr:hypothetical protein [Rhodospirillales bacterium]